jgi:hypothetical protein
VLENKNAKKISKKRRAKDVKSQFSESSFDAFSVSKVSATICFAATEKTNLKSL